MKIWSYTAQNVEFKHWAHVCKYSHHWEVGNYSLGHILLLYYIGIEYYLTGQCVVNYPIPTTQPRYRLC